MNITANLRLRFVGAMTQVFNVKDNRLYLSIYLQHLLVETYSIKTDSKLNSSLVRQLSVNNSIYSSKVIQQFTIMLQSVKSRENTALLYLHHKSKTFYRNKYNLNRIREKKRRRHKQSSKLQTEQTNWNMEFSNNMNQPIKTTDTESALDKSFYWFF